MQINQSSKYAAALRRIKQPMTYGSDASYRVVIIYPFIAIDSVGREDINQCRDFFTLSCIRQIVLENAINIVKIGGDVESIEIVGTSPDFAASAPYPMPTIRHGETFVSRMYSYDVQQKIEKVSEVISRLITTDPQLSSYRPIIDKIILNNLIEVPVVVGTSLDTFPSALVASFIVSILLSGVTFESIDSNINRIYETFNRITGFTLEAPQFRNHYQVISLRRAYRRDLAGRFLNFINRIVTGEFARSHGWGNSVSYNEYISSSLGTGNLSKLSSGMAADIMIKSRQDFERHLSTIFKSVLSLFYPVPPESNLSDIIRVEHDTIDRYFSTQFVDKISSVVKQFMGDFANASIGTRESFVDNHLSSECSRKQTIDFTHRPISEVSSAEDMMRFLESLGGIAAQCRAVYNTLFSLIGTISRDCLDLLNSARNDFRSTIGDVFSRISGVYNAIVSSSTSVRIEDRSIPAYIRQQMVSARASAPLTGDAIKRMLINDLPRVAGMTADYLTDIVMGVVAISIRHSLCKFVLKATIELDLSDVSATDPINCVFLIDDSILQLCQSIIATYVHGLATVGRDTMSSMVSDRRREHLLSVLDATTETTPSNNQVVSSRTNLRMSDISLMHEPRRGVDMLCNFTRIPNLMVISTNNKEMYYKFFFEQRSKRVTMSQMSSFIKGFVQKGG